MISPYSWLSEYTSVDKWFGGVVGANGRPIDSFEDLQNFIASNCPELVLEHQEEVPFLIREHERKYQYGVSHCSIWRRIAP